VSGTFSVFFPALPVGVTVISESHVQTTLAAGGYLALTVSFTPASSPYLSLLCKSTDGKGDVLYPALLADITSS
jgi:hypothetical protein